MPDTVLNTSLTLLLLFAQNQDVLRANINDLRVKQGLWAIKSFNIVEEEVDFTKHRIITNEALLPSYDLRTQYNQFCHTAYVKN